MKTVPNLSDQFHLKTVTDPTAIVIAFIAFVMFAMFVVVLGYLYLTYPGARYATPNTEGASTFQQYTREGLLA
jgi:hypothetical protein